MRTTQCGLAPFLFSFLLSCTGTDVGNGDVDVDFTMYNESFTLGSIARSDVQSANGFVDITQGWVSVSDLRLRSGAGCDDEQELELVDSVPVDLFAAGTQEKLAQFDIGDGDYCRFLVKFDGFTGTLPPGAPSELAGSAIVLEGSRADGTKFVLQSEQDHELIFNGRGGEFSITGATNALVVGFDATGLFGWVDLDDAVVDGDGVIQISSKDNKDLLDRFHSNLDVAAELFDDDNGNGDLDEDERGDADVLAD